MHLCENDILINSYDPTRTTTLRNAFVRASDRRFNELIKVIKIAVVDEDCFGAKKREITTQQMNSPGYHAFDYPRSAARVEAFMQWLKLQVDKGLLTIQQFRQVGAAIENAWTNIYVADSYKRGIQRARYEMQKAGMNVPSIQDSGGIEIVFGLPFHIDRVGVLFTRVFSGLQGITTAMENNIAQILAQGMIDGDGPALLARKMIAAIDGTGAGTLGITDKLGRFIPAKRRAELLARTEIIRGHHLGMIQEYRNWGVLGIKVKAEFLTAGDDRVCPKCASLEGNIYTLDEIEPMIPVHPLCFIDHQIPIYTSNGWKQISKIEVGDLVLTHKGRFRKVTELIRYTNISEVIRIKFKGDLALTMTCNHPILMENGLWQEAVFCKKGDKIILLGNYCRRCGKSIPYFRKYCSRTCLSKDITDKQWGNPEHRKKVSDKNRKYMLKQYATGKRDKNEIIKKAQEKRDRMVKEGNWANWMDEDFFERVRKVTNTSEMRKKSSERMKKNNPMNDPIIVEKAQKSVQEFYRNNPERRLNARMAKHRKSWKMTSIEKKMSELLDSINVQYIYQYPILKYDVDFAIPGLMIAIECDGVYWHQDEEKDAERDRIIENEGWTILHYTDEKINKCLSEIKKELSRILCNHLNEFSFASWEVEEVKRWELNKPRKHYNFSVEEDESYIAKGVVVHNCRCIALPFIED